MADASGSTAWVYDIRGRLIKETKTITGSGIFLTQWGYNSGNQLIWMKYPGDNNGAAGEQVNFSYRPQNVVKSVTGTDTYVQSTTYDAAGRIIQLIRGAGTLTTNYAFYAWTDKVTVDGTLTGQGGRLKNITTGTLQNLSYIYDAAGDVKSIVDTQNNESQTQTFLYDDLQRLTSAVAAGGTNGTYNESYVYNSTTGNLSSKAGVSYTYGTQATGCADGALNKPHTVVTAGSNTYCYDKNGNINRRVIGGSSTYNLAYDAENHLTAVNGATSATLVYDGDGNRVKATVGSTTTAYLGNYFEYSGSTMKKTYYAGTTRVAVRVGSTISYLLTDHLGSTTNTINTSGTETGELRYKAWGETRYTSGSTPTSVRFTGQRQESTLGGTEGLYFYDSRWYDPALGRWAQPDFIIPNPYDSQSWDRYAYVNNNAVRYTDPSGHMLIGDGDQGKCKKANCGWTPSNDSSKKNVTQDPPFDSTLGGNKEKPSKEHKNFPLGKYKSPPNPIGIGLGVVVTVLGVSGLAGGIGIAFEDPPVGLLLASGSLIVTTIGAEITYRSLGDLRPPSWPDSLLNISGVKRP